MGSLVNLTKSSRLILAMNGRLGTRLVLEGQKCTRADKHVVTEGKWGLVGPTSDSRSSHWNGVNN